MSRRQESRMTPSAVTRLNIPVTHSLKTQMGLKKMSKSWVQDIGLVSNEFTNIDKRKKRI